MAAGLLIAAATLVRFFLPAGCRCCPTRPITGSGRDISTPVTSARARAWPTPSPRARTLFGSNNFGIRFFAVVLSAGTAWQVFLLARRWYDDVTGLIAVLLVSVVPLYAVGAVVMTIDPLSAFFWIWAANLFSSAIAEGRWRDWLLTGFAVGLRFPRQSISTRWSCSRSCFFLLAAPRRRAWLARPHFWAMLRRGGVLHAAGHLVERAARLDHGGAAQASRRTRRPVHIPSFHHPRFLRPAGGDGLAAALHRADRARGHADRGVAAPPDRRSRAIFCCSCFSFRLRVLRASLRCICATSRTGPRSPT